jgi:hypothetical protein
MTSYEFNLLQNNNLKAEVVWQYGVFLTKRRSPHTNKVQILLYQLPKFYVEIFYDAERNVIVRFLSFISTDHLTPYLPGIDINEVLK